MSKQTDEFDAIRMIVDAVSQFDMATRDRIVRSALAWLGTPGGQPRQRSADPPGPSGESTAGSPTAPQASDSRTVKTDIKTFIEQKAPRTDIQFAATVAFYYQFEASQEHRKDEIGRADLLEACRQAGWDRPPHPTQTLRNAAMQGLLDKGSERGTFRLNNVGENLVAMALPGEGGVGSGRRRRAKRRQSTKARKEPRKKAKKTSRGRK